jgi:polyhydroxyalkanoate synthesis regulator phasin
MKLSDSDCRKIRSAKMVYERHYDMISHDLRYGKMTSDQAMRAIDRLKRDRDAKIHAVKAESRARARRTVSKRFT